MADRIYDIEIRDLFALFRYLIGLAFVIFGMFYLLYKDYAVRVFLQQYDTSEKVTGLVVSCKEEQPRHVSNSNSKNKTLTSIYEGDGGEEQQKQKPVKQYKVDVIYTAAMEHYEEDDRRKRKEPAVGPLLVVQQEYKHKFVSNWLAPQGTTMDLFMIPSKSRSAITREMLETNRNKFTWLHALAVLVPGLSLAGGFVWLCYDRIQNEFPPDKGWVGWVMFVTLLILIVLASFSLCDYQFQEYVFETFLSSYPIQRRDSLGNIVNQPPPPTTVFLLADDHPDAVVIPPISPSLSMASAATSTRSTGTASSSPSDARRGGRDQQQQEEDPREQPDPDGSHYNSIV